VVRLFPFRVLGIECLSGEKREDQRRQGLAVIQPTRWPVLSQGFNPKKVSKKCNFIPLSGVLLQGKQAPFYNDFYTHTVAVDA